MLEAIRVAGGLKATGDRPATGRAVVIPKNSEKCSMILNCKEQNHASGVKPKGFRLPQVERICDRLVFENKQSRWWMCTPPPQHAAPTGHAGQGDSNGPPHQHTRAHSTWVADPNSPPSGRAVKDRDST